MNRGIKELSERDNAHYGLQPKFLNLSALAISAIGVGVTMYGLLRAESKDNSAIFFGFIVIVLAQVALLWAVWKNGLQAERRLLKEIKLKEELLDTITQEKIQLSNDADNTKLEVEKLEDRAVQVTKLFSDLHEKENRFHGYVTSCITAVLNSTELDESVFSDLNSEYKFLLHHICDTAVAIKRMRYAHPIHLACNIKNIFLENGEACYAVVEESDVDVGRLKSRIQETQGKNGAHPKVLSNMKYDELVNRTPLFKIINSIDDFLDEAERRNSGRLREDKFEYPQAEERNEWQSCIIYALRVDQNTLPEGLDTLDHHMESAGGDSIMGFICLDSMTPQLFDDYDCAILGELAYIASGAMRGYRMAQAIKSLKALQ